MSKKKLLDFLSEESPTYISSQLKMRMDEIKEAKRRGFTNKQIVEALKKTGIVISESTFRCYISRYSKPSNTKKTQAKINTFSNDIYKDGEPSEKTNSLIHQTSNDLKDIKKISSIKNNLEDFAKIAKGKI